MEPVGQKQGEGQDDLDQQVTLTSLHSELRQGCPDRKTPAHLSTRPHPDAMGKGPQRWHHCLVPQKRGDQMARLQLSLRTPDCGIAACQRGKGADTASPATPSRSWGPEGELAHFGPNLEGLSCPRSPGDNAFQERGWHQAQGHEARQPWGAGWGEWPPRPQPSFWAPDEE